MAEIRFDQEGLRQVLEGPLGPIARDLSRRAIRVESAAKLNATGKEYGDGTRGPRVQTGRLRSSITWELGHDSLGLFADIGTNVYYGRYLELGLLRNGARYPFLEPALAAGLN